MKIAELMANKLEKLFQEASLENIKADTYKDLCGALHVTKMYYDMDLGGDDRYRNHRTGKLVIDQDDDFCVEIASMLCVHDVLGATTLKATEEIIKK